MDSPGSVDQSARGWRLLPLLTVWISVFFVHCSEVRKVASPPLFEKVSPRRTGIDFVNSLREEPLLNSINYLYFNDGGGVAVGDINNDGLSDIYFTANMNINRLYLNKGGFQFEDVTESAGVGGGVGGWSTGATMADVNGDGLLDIYVCQSNYLDRKGSNLLFINEGDLTFSEASAAYDLDFAGLSRQSAFLDYDLDGDLDMYLLNHSVHAKGTHRDTSLRKVVDHEAGDKLFRNDGDRFVDVSSAARIYQSALGYGLGVAVGDVNLDGYPDIFISNDFHEDDYFYYNNGDGTFTEALARSMGHTSSASMGNDLADFNNDGLLDVVVLDMLPEREEIRKSSVYADSYDIYDVKRRFGYHHQVRRNTLQLNRGPSIDQELSSIPAIHLFSEIGQLAGIHATDWSWASLFVDLDNDGHKDLFITNGIYRRLNDLDYLDYTKRAEEELGISLRADQKQSPVIEKDKLSKIIDQMPTVPESNYAYQSQGDLTFVNRAAEWGLGDPGFSSGAAYADFDNDGDMDLVVNNTNAQPGVYRNRLYDSGEEITPAVNYLKVRLNGKGGNRFGVGAKVVLHAGEDILFQEMFPSRGFQSSVEPVLNFGLGSVAEPNSLEIIWPTGEYQVMKNLPVDQTITLNQTDATATYSYRPRNGDEPIFQNVTRKVRLNYRHQENKFIEFNREPFIPHFVSMEGPAFSAGDVNGDGLDDIYLGGAKHQTGSLFLQNGQGSWDPAEKAAFAMDSQAEDVDAAFFDADGDGDSDLYVVSGGNEFWGKMEPLRDRLYVNQGDGRFRKAKGALPEIYANGACVEPADFDKDGDVDLFVGSRSVPQQYGIIPQSYLLINDGHGQFGDETLSKAPELSKVGMVTDAVWADLNGDAFQDLVVVGEWMPVTVFENQGGQLVDATENYGLLNTQGWWSTVAAGDFDEDGFIDLVAGNLGLNSLLETTSRAPVQLFIDDFSGNGRLDQILTYYSDGRVYPMANRDMMFANIPFLEEKYFSHGDYAGQSVQDIFSSEQLQAAAVRIANEFSSLLLLNSGEETLTVRPLPMEAQFSPMQAILIDDFDRDGHEDILSGGNFSGVRPDRGIYDASYGTLLLGNGTGMFSAVTLKESGFVVTGEVRQMKSIRNASGKRMIMAARNNDTAVVFQLTEKERDHTQKQTMEPLSR